MLSEQLELERRRIAARARVYNNLVIYSVAVTLGAAVHDPYADHCSMGGQKTALQKLAKRPEGDVTGNLARDLLQLMEKMREGPACTNTAASNPQP